MLLGYDFMKTMLDFYLFNWSLFSRHQLSIVLMALLRDGLQSHKMAMSSANNMMKTPRIFWSSCTKSLITKLKKNGEVLLPWGQPRFRLIVLFPSSTFIEADDKIHLAIISSLGWFLSVFSNLLIKIWWSIESNACLISNKASQVEFPCSYLALRILINLYRCTSQPCSGINPNWYLV